MLFISGLQPYSAQIPDSTEQEESVLPPTSKSKQGESASLYSTPPKSKSDWKKKFYVGGYLGLTFGTYTNIDVSPIVGYRFLPNFSMGIGFIYNYTSQNNVGLSGNDKISTSNWGGRINANYVLFNFLALGVEYQYLSVDYYSGWDNASNSPIYQKEPVNILFVGGGISQKVGRNAAIYIMVYYDLLQNQYSPYYNNDVVFRIGAAGGF